MNASSLLKWTETVKFNCGGKCAWCGSTKKIVAHHIQPVAVAPILVKEIENGVALCRKCHDKAHKQLNPPEYKNGVPIYIRVEPDLKKWLEAQAEKERRTVSDYVRLKLEDLRKPK